MLAALRQENTKQLTCKNKKLHHLKIKFNKLPKDKYNIPVLNLSSESLDLSSLKYGLHQSFVDKNKYVKRNVAVGMESIAVRLDKYVDISRKETFHEFLKSSTNIISNNIYSERDNTVKLLSPLIKNDKIVILAADKESCTIILNKSDYIMKVNNIIEEGIQQGKYIETIDTTQSNLKHFQVFLYSHFKKSEHYDQIHPVSNQPGGFFATAKTHRFTSLNDITVENLKLRPIIDLTGTYTYNTSKVIANYLQPLSKNQYTISDTLKFPDLLKSADTNDNYEDVSYDVESHFSLVFQLLRQLSTS